ncbi:MAG TPA: Na+/H+ antiporter NhaC family protein [Vicinamibacterales bacterium]|nr:Na+/H+ antiporter NhaC family protein [Vicinamibacterales bacterium]
MPTPAELQTRAGAPEDPLLFRGGMAGLFAPFGVMFVGVLWLGLSGVAIPEAYWPVVVLAVFVGLVLARDQRRYVSALVAGISSSMLAVMLLAWFLAGILGHLLGRTGIIEGLVWAATAAGVAGAWFPLLTFLISAGLSLSTGTSIGTVVAATPILFPAGFAIGADPLLLVGAILGGAFFGDNLAPISDTTIVSAYSQGTDVNRVVRSRLRYAAVAVLMAVAVYVAFAVTAQVPDVPSGSLAAASPRGLIMLVVPGLLITMMLKGGDLVPALLYTLAFGFVLALVTGLLQPGDLLVIDATSFEVGGVIVAGIQSMVGISVFTIFLMALAGTLEAGGLVQWLVRRAERFATSVRRAELAIVGSTVLLNVLTAAGTPSMVILGPFVRRLGHRFRIAPWRRGNLMDACSTTVIGFLPYSIAVLIPFSFIGDTVARAGVTNFTPVHVVPYVFYCWALLLTIVVAAVTGWGRETMSRAAHTVEARELYGP